MQWALIRRIKVSYSGDSKFKLNLTGVFLDFDFTSNIMRAMPGNWLQSEIDSKLFKSREYHQICLAFLQPSMSLLVCSLYASPLTGAGKHKVALCSHLVTETSSCSWQPQGAVCCLPVPATYPPSGDCFPKVNVVHPTRGQSENGDGNPKSNIIGVKQNFPKLLLWRLGKWGSWLLSYYIQRFRRCFAYWHIINVVA